MKQLYNLILGHMVSNLAKEHGAEARSRMYTQRSHVVSLLYTAPPFFPDINPATFQQAE